MESLLQENHPAIYAAMFFSTFCIVALWESFSPCRDLRVSIRQRWFSNACLLASTTFLFWLLYPGVGIGSSLIAAQQEDWGLLRYLELPYWAAVVTAIIVMDLGHYLIHYLFHRVPILWRMHRLHHTDQDFDVTTAFRFHPFESVLEHGMNLIVVLILGPPILAVILFLFSYILTTFWVHGNLRMPGNCDRYLRWLLVTPEMHRTHHSQDPAETNSNYGGLFSCWDRFFGNYVDAPAAGHAGMSIGIAEFSNERHNRIGWMLLNPFLAPDNSESPAPAGDKSNFHTPRHQ